MAATKDQDRQAHPLGHVVVLRVGEVFLKGRNRPRFESILLANVRRTLTGQPSVSVEPGQGRLFARCQEGDVSTVVGRLSRVFGITSVSAGLEVEPELGSIAAGALRLVREQTADTPGCSFRVTAKRSDKSFPLNSQEIGREVGAVIVGEAGLPVDLHNPDLVVGVEVGPRCTFVFAGRTPGPGGLPVGTTGEVGLLLSGGIDSPVAGYLMQKRGCVLHPVYFHSFPYTGERTQDKVERLARLLAPAQPAMELSVVPFTDAQLAVRDRCPADLAVVLYRRLMMRIASKLAGGLGCRALATGENLGQVASQTLENLAVIERAATLPVLRPLLTHDKAETITLARSIGTYDLSIEPYDDCCSLFVPKHPATRATLAQVERAEGELDVQALVDGAVGGTEQVVIAS
jgi:thiamine biosynthesis protein ThiI